MGKRYRLQRDLSGTRGLHVLILSIFHGSRSDHIIKKYEVSQNVRSILPTALRGFFDNLHDIHGVKRPVNLHH
jgi:hypothetical protein